VESTAMTPIPPLVVSSTVADDIVERLRGALMSGAIQTELAAHFDVLVMTRFAAVKPTDYAVLLSQAREADRQEIPTPALGLPYRHTLRYRTEMIQMIQTL